MLRVALLLLLFIIISRLFWRTIDGFIEGIRGEPQRPHVPQRGVPMARDPVCGTFVLPEHAVTLLDGRTRLFFCSEACRDKYRARPSAGPGRSGHVEGRTA
jgi:YHS domain-containing protein